MPGNPRARRVAEGAPLARYMSSGTSGSSHPKNTGREVKPWLTNVSADDGTLGNG